MLLIVAINAMTLGREGRTIMKTTEEPLARTSPRVISIEMYREGKVLLGPRLRDNKVCAWRLHAKRRSGDRSSSTIHRRAYFGSHGSDRSGVLADPIFSTLSPSAYWPLLAVILLLLVLVFRTGLAAV